MYSAPGTSERAVGNVALLVAFVLVLLTVAGAVTSWAPPMAIVLAIVGAGLRIEAAVARYRPNPEIDSGG